MALYVEAYMHHIDWLKNVQATLVTVVSVATMVKGRR
jgi:hypothetical protein